MSKPPASATVTSGTATAAPEPTGCCIIKLPGGAGGQRFEHITEEDCRQRTMALGGAYEWDKGECA